MVSENSINFLHDQKLSRESNTVGNSSNTNSIGSIFFYYSHQWPSFLNFTDVTANTSIISSARGSDALCGMENDVLIYYSSHTSFLMHQQTQNIIFK